MAQVVVEVNGRPYTMQCADGEEHQLRELASVLDAQVAKIREAVGPVGDIRLLLMAGLMIADQLADSRRSVAELQSQIAVLREKNSDADAQEKATEEEIADRINRAAMRLEALASEMTAGG
jgi:cell division protein ZapA